MRTPVTSRSVVFDELCASEKAKHIDAAQQLLHGYEVPVLHPRLDVLDPEYSTLGKMVLPDPPTPQKPQKMQPKP